MPKPCQILGIGPDITLQAWAKRDAAALAPFVVLGDPDLLGQRSGELGMNIEIEVVDTAEAGRRHLPFLGVNSATMKDQIRARISWRQVVQRKFRGQVSVNASQVDKVISDETPAEGQQKSIEFQLQRVRLELPNTPNQRTIANRLVEAERLRTRIKSCKNLTEVTKLVRKASVKSIGRKSASQLAQPTRAILLAAKEGQMTPPAITSSGIESYVVCAS